MKGKKRNNVPVRLVDVARTAGVSTMTASRVMRGEKRVAEASRDAVQAAALRLGYVPNQVAGSLRSRRSGIVAVIVPTLTGSVFAETIRGMTDAFDVHDYQLMIGESSYDIEREERVISALIQRRPDAVIVVGVKHTPQARLMLQSAGIPVAEIWDQTTHPIDNVVGFSNFHAAYDMVKGLLKKGYRNIGLATGPIVPGNRAAERTEGYMAALRELDSAPGPSIVVPYYNFLDSALKGGREIADFLRNQRSIDCLFCTNELIAIGAIVACSRQGMNIPQDVAVAGFGDVEAASLITPDLTTVKIRGLEMGRRAAEVIARRLVDDTVEPEIIDVGYEIIWRNSA